MAMPRFMVMGPCGPVLVEPAIIGRIVVYIAQESDVRALWDGLGCEESDTEFKRRGAAKSPCFCHIRCLHPETSQFLEVWDFFFLFVLAIIAVMIPLEVAFTTYETWFIAYPDKKCPSRYIKDPRMIAINYLKTWFVVDLISSFPCHAIERGSDVHLPLDGLLLGRRCLCGYDSSRRPNLPSLGPQFHLTL
ncbi:Potassium voltage-gated channel subfamily H member 5 [Symbiodinium microadriaticum]|uniref:Potassium voltage-gated channel subfamily H member 5 n=1 Tax=Symbiodinium microadriaticum TaxID=2951 RepID=A0A1Q9DPD9_SYMMI|nr:Potassium voltage-gated channel subfamily H member 5 [Symbiodinium microadriaticum]